MRAVARWLEGYLDITRWCARHFAMDSGNRLCDFRTLRPARTISRYRELIKWHNAWMQRLAEM